MAATRGSEAGTGRGASAVVRPGCAGDAAAVARLHAEQIVEGFLSSLGPRFLARLYRRMCRTQGSFLLVAEERGTVAGFVAGSVDTRRLFARFLVRDGATALLGAPIRLLSSWRRVLETLRHGRGDPVASADGELLAIAVDPAHRGRGIGAALVAALLEEMTRRRARSVEVVVGADNGAAVAMYRAAGFVRVRAFELHPGTTSLTLQYRDAAVPGPGADP